MIDPADTSGLAFAAIALSTAALAAAVRRGEISVSEMRAIIAHAHALVHDQAGYVVDPKAAQAADDFLSAAEALADPTALRIADDTWPRRHSLRSPGRKLPGTTTNRNSRRGAAERHRAERARRGGVSRGEKKPR
jgi:hypothetical protein